MHKDASVFQLPDWTKALMEEYGGNAFAFACEDEQKNIIGLLPVMETLGFSASLATYRLGKRLSSLPRTPVAGPLAVNSDATKLLLDAAADYASKNGLLLEIKSPHNDLDRVNEKIKARPWKQTYAVNIHGDGKLVSYGNSERARKLRQAVNKACRLGVSVRWTDSEDDLGVWYRLYAETMRWHGSLPRNYRFFQALWRKIHAQGSIRLLMAECEVDGRVQTISAFLYLTYGKIFHCWLNGRRRDMLKMNPNHAAHARAIQDAYLEGFTVYDFGDVEDGQHGLIDFKKKWGAEPRSTYRFYSQLEDGRSEKNKESNRTLLRLKLAVWRCIPLRVLVMFSDKIYYYL